MRHINVLILSTFMLFSLVAYAQHDTHEHEPETTHEDTSAHDHLQIPEHAEDIHGAAHEEKAFNASEMIMHHVLDNHDWHITDIPSGKDAQGHTTYTPIALRLPWIFYSSRDGFVFSSTHDLDAKNYLVYHDHVYALKAGAVRPHADAHGAIHLEKEEWEAYKAENVDASVTLLDFSITKTSFQILIIAALMLWVFLSIARSYKKNTGAPKGTASLFEPIIVFVRDEIAKPYLGDKAMRFTPYLLTLFFFIWFSNLLGLTPLNSNIAGNISITAALALLTFIIINVNGSKDYWVHIFANPGVPPALRYSLMLIVEVVGVFTKPFALMIRLFANISAGHFMVLSLVSILFILGKGGKSIGGALGAMPISLLFTFGIYFLEFVVAIIQAYIFTLLTAVFVGMAMESHDHEHEHAHAEGDHH
jgi:F-type H+-transporting ATPase subunit a